jgi:hypothetical protein
MTDEGEEEDEYTEEELAELTTTSEMPKELQDWLLRGFTQWANGQT